MLPPSPPLLLYSTSWLGGAYFLHTYIFSLHLLNLFAWSLCQVHMEAERKAMPGDADILPALDFHEKITYKVGTKVSNIRVAFTLSSRLFLFCQTIYYVDIFLVKYEADKYERLTIATYSSNKILHVLW